jgi:hypothetical protein
MEQLMKDSLQSVEVKNSTRLEHLDFSTAQGNARWHFLRRGQADVSGASYGVDWWRVQDVRKGLRHQLLDAIKRKCRFWRV